MTTQPGGVVPGPRRRRVSGRLRSLIGLLALVVVGALPTAQALRQRAPAPSDDRAVLYDLQADEKLGGHTLERHVGRSDEQLAERLRREPQISAASTYSDVTTARRVVALAVTQSKGRIDTWASRQGSRPNLVLNYRASGAAIGRSLFRGERSSRPCFQALVVLRWLGRENRWIVLTSYPETRR